VPLNFTQFIKEIFVIEKKMSILTRIASGVIGVLGILAAAYGAFKQTNDSTELSEFIKYPFIAFACIIFLYAAFTGKNLLSSLKKDTTKI
jgi:membrane-bound ClpP family serine protease